MSFHPIEELVTYRPESRLSWSEGGSWPHQNHFHFNEAVVSAHLTLLGYQVLRDYGIRPSKRATTNLSTQILHAVVGKSASEYLLGDAFDRATDGLSGLPDLFVYRALSPENDPKVVYVDCDWFFVEVKGPGDHVHANQQAFLHAVAGELGTDRARVYRTVPERKAKADED